ncbi:MAG: hypothetical protein ACJAS4_003348 [Bacteriovoracaceae bacterium]|jgi:hypothetical protein
MKLFSLFLTFYSLSTFALTGKEIAEKVYSSNREFDTIQTSEMKLIDKSGNTRERSFTTFAIDNNRYDSKSLIVFSKPKKVSKTSMLTYNQKGDNSLQWLYLPALKKSRKISSSKKSGRFVGSDIFFEDLEDREVDLDNHKLLKTIKKNGSITYKVQSTPKDKSSSSYKKSLIFVDAKSWLVKKVIFYKKGKKPLKTLTVKEVKKIGKTYIPILTSVTHHKLKHKTIIKVLKTKFNNKLKDSFFKKSVLEKPSKLKKYL